MVELNFSSLTEVGEFYLMEICMKVEHPYSDASVSSLKLRHLQTVSEDIRRF